MSPLYKKLLLWFCAANISVLLVSVFVTDRIARYASGDELDWEHLAQTTLASYEQHGLAGLAATADALRKNQGVMVTLFRGEQNLLKRRMPMLRPFLPQLLASEKLVLRIGEGRWLAAVAVTSRSGERLHFVALRGPAPPHLQRKLLLWVQVGLSLLVIAALGFWLARSLTRPIAVVQAATRRMAAGDLSARADEQTTARRDELGALARDFNHMATRTETLVQQQRTVLQEVSHEIRSPLARLHLLLELARQGGNAEAQQQLDRAAGEITKLDALIDEVLNLSRLEGALPGLARAAITADALFETVAGEQALELDAKHITLHRDLQEGLQLQGDAALLTRALGNVLGNAIKFSAAGSAIWLTARADAGRICLSVRDQGPGVPPAQLAKLFKPFFRGDNAARAQGHGLGLAIAQRIVSAHGGQMSARNADGSGLLVHIELLMA